MTQVAVIKRSPDSERSGSLEPGESFPLELIRTGHRNKDKAVSFVDLMWVDRCVKDQTGCRGFHTKLVRVAARGGGGVCSAGLGCHGLERGVAHLSYRKP